MTASFFSLSKLGGFAIDQMEFICWAQGIRTMLQRCYCYNISDVDTGFRPNQHLLNKGVKQTRNSRRIVLIGYRH